MIIDSLSLGSCMFLRFPSLPVSRRHLLRLAGRPLSNRQLLAACLCICESCSDPSEFFERRFSLFQVGSIESSGEPIIYFSERSVRFVAAARVAVLL